MRPGSLIREALAAAVSQRVSSVMVALIVAAMCVTTLLTVGRTVAAEESVRVRLEEAGSRQLIVEDAARAGFISAAAIGVVDSLDGVQAAVGVDAARDAVNARVGSGGEAVPAWAVHGDLAQVAVLVWGRWPREGEAVVSIAAADTLNMDAPVGALSLDTGSPGIAVVGSFSPRPGFGEFAAGALVVAGSRQPASSMRVLVADAESAQAVQDATLTILGRADPNDLNVHSPATLADVQGEVLGDLRLSNRLLLLLVMGAGAVLVSVVVLAGVLLGRADLGRRRALGASRGVLTMLVVGRTLIVAAPSVLAGLGVGVALLARGGQVPQLVFIAAVAVLATLVAGCASVLPALLAARQDPLKVLRTP